MINSLLVHQMSLGIQIPDGKVEKTSLNSLYSLHAGLCCIKPNVDLNGRGALLYILLKNLVLPVKWT